MQSTPDTAFRGSRRTVALDLVSKDILVRNRLLEVIAKVPGVSVRHRIDSITALAANDPRALVVLDLYMRRSSRLDAGFWSLAPAGSRIIALCRPEDPRLNLRLAIQAGVRALLTRDFSAVELLTAIQAVRAGGLHICSDLLDHFLKQIAHQMPGSQSKLTNREIEALRCVADGLTRRQISWRMEITEASVNRYLSRLRTKLNAKCDGELWSRAIELGLLHSPSGG